MKTDVQSMINSMNIF